MQNSDKLNKIYRDEFRFCNLFSNDEREFIENQLNKKIVLSVYAEKDENSFYSVYYTYVDHDDFVIDSIRFFDKPTMLTNIELYKPKQTLINIEKLGTIFINYK